MAPLIPVARPRLPAASAILPYLKEIDANRWYTNHGLLWLRFQGLLADFWGVESGDVALVANATIGLALALRASGARPGGVCLMPSWTFVASPAAAIEAGLKVRFVDVDPATWMPDPAAIAARADLDEVAAIMVVSPFGMPFDVAAWDALADKTGIPVVIDAAAAFDSLRAGGPLAIGRSPMVVSLHATKVFGIGEGGAVVSRDKEWLERFRRLTTFGFLGSRAATLPGINAKVSEYAAAIGLAAFEMWPAARTRFAALIEQYRRRLAEGSRVALPPRFGEGWVTSTMNILWPADCPDGAARLAAEGIGTLRWWGEGCHAQPAYADCARDPLPVTEDLARRTLGLPFWLDMRPTQIDAVCDAVERIAEGARARKGAPLRGAAGRKPAGLTVRAQIARAVAASG